MALPIGLVVGLGLAGGVAAQSDPQITDAMRKNIAIPYPEPPPEQTLAHYRGETAPPRPRATTVAEPFDWARIADPPRSAGPWTRWWWPGGAVDPATLRSQLTELRDAGFAGAEVQPFTLGVADSETMRRAASFDSPGYYATLAGMLEDAARLGLRIDLTNLSGWPAGGPQVGLDDALQEMSLASTEFEGGRAVSIAVPPPQPAPSDWGRARNGPGYFSPAHAHLLDVIVARKAGGGLTDDLYDLRDQVQLDPATVRVVTTQVKDGILQWQAPPGRWYLVATYMLPEPEAPAFGASSRPGLVADVLRKQVVEAQLAYGFGKRTGLPPLYGQALRGIFNDSLEFKANRLTSADFLREFKARRGYDLAPFLPATWINGRDNFFTWDLMRIDPVPMFRFGPDDDRIRYDYQRTLSDLMVERFMRATRLWTEARGLTSRGQSFGFDLDVIRALGENDIPDTEQLYADGRTTFLKLASSAAALYGRPLVASESFVWSDRDYTATAGKIKAAADKLFLAGVNHLFYHGMPYPLYRGAAEPVGPQGWHPFGIPGIGFSDNFSKGAAIWADEPELNRYITRAQNLLRQGKPDVDVLIYYPFIGYPSGGQSGDEMLAGGAFPLSNPHTEPPAPGDPAVQKLLASLPHRVSDARLDWLAKIRPLLLELDRRGITWGWTNGDALRTRRVTADGRFAAGGRYRAILLTDTASAPVEDLDALARLQRGGAAVFTLGALPTRQPGYLDARRNDERARLLGAELARTGAIDSVQAFAKRVASLVKGAIAIDPLAGNVRRYSRVLADGGSIHFFANQDDALERATIALPVGRRAWWFDAVSGRACPAIAPGGEVALELQPFESRFLIVGIKPPAALVDRTAVCGDASVLREWPLDRWSIVTPTLDRPAGLLFDWSNDAALRYAGDTAVYATDMTLATKDVGVRYLLQLGLVPGSARVIVNGVDAASAGLPPGRVDVTRMMRVGSNHINVRYTPSQRNAFVGKALAGDKRYARFAAKPPGAVVPAGLITPIKLLAVRNGG